MFSDFLFITLTLQSITKEYDDFVAAKCSTPNERMRVLQCYYDLTLPRQAMYFCCSAAYKIKLYDLSIQSN